MPLNIEAEGTAADVITGAVFRFHSSYRTWAITSVTKTACPRSSLLLKGELHVRRPTETFGAGNNSNRTENVSCSEVFIYLN